MEIHAIIRRNKVIVHDLNRISVVNELFPQLNLNSIQFRLLVRRFFFLLFFLHSINFINLSVSSNQPILRMTLQPVLLEPSGCTHYITHSNSGELKNPPRSVKQKTSAPKAHSTYSASSVQTPRQTPSLQIRPSN